MSRCIIHQIKHDGSRKLNFGASSVQLPSTPVSSLSSSGSHSLPHWSHAISLKKYFGTKIYSSRCLLIFLRWKRSDWKDNWYFIVEARVRKKKSPVSFTSQKILQSTGISHQAITISIRFHRFFFGELFRGAYTPYLYYTVSISLSARFSVHIYSRPKIPLHHWPQALPPTSLAHSFAFYSALAACSYTFNPLKVKYGVVFFF